MSSCAMRSEAGLEAPTGFDAAAAAYEAWYATPVGQLVDRLEKNAVFALIGEGPERMVLDLSCGTGNYALTLAQRGMRVVGVDISEPMLGAARSKGSRAGLPVTFVRADARALPFRPGAFDLVTLILGLEFIAEPGRALAEAHRALKPGGRLVVAILNRDAPWTLWRRLKRLVVRSVWRNASFLGAHELRGLLSALAFADLRCERAVHFVPLGSRWPVGWLGRWERVGARWLPASAAFLAVAARRR